jgi:hypothetical protein
VPTRPILLRRLVAVGLVGLALAALVGFTLRVPPHGVGSPIASIEQSSVTDATVPAAPNPLFPLVGLVGSAWIPVRAARHRRRLLAEARDGAATTGESRWRALLLGAPPLTTS